MTDDEKKLLNNVLDSLDRLFDNESKLIDIYSLIFATSKALTKSQHFSILGETSKNLEEIVLLNLITSKERTEALNATNKLRLYLAAIVDF